MCNQNQENNKYQARINQKTVKNKISKIKEDLHNKNIKDKNINILTSGIESKEDYLIRQKRLKRIGGDKLAKRAANEVSLDLINKTYKKIFKKNN